MHNIRYTSYKDTQIFFVFGPFKKKFEPKKCPEQVFLFR